MNEAIGIRLEQKFLKKIEKISKDEIIDRSNAIRKLLHLGYRNYIQNKAYHDYIKGKITISQAAQDAEITIWEMQKYITDQGFKSQYSIEDLEEEMNL